MSKFYRIPDPAHPHSLRSSINSRSLSRAKQYCMAIPKLLTRTSNGYLKGWFALGAIAHQEALLIKQSSILHRNFSVVNPPEIHITILKSLQLKTCFALFHCLNTLQTGWILLPDVKLDSGENFTFLARICISCM